jgi:hypothetical protein
MSLSFTVSHCPTISMHAKYMSLYFTVFPLSHCLTAMTNTCHSLLLWPTVPPSHCHDKIHVNFFYSVLRTVGQNKRNWHVFVMAVRWCDSGTQTPSQVVVSWPRRPLSEPGDFLWQCLSCRICLRHHFVLIYADFNSFLKLFFLLKMMLKTG